MIDAAERRRKQVCRHRSTEGREGRTPRRAQAGASGVDVYIHERPHRVRSNVADTRGQASRQLTFENQVPRLDVSTTEQAGRKCRLIRVDWEVDDPGADVGSDDGCVSWLDRPACV